MGGGGGGGGVTTRQVLGTLRHTSTASFIGCSNRSPVRPHDGRETVRLVAAVGWLRPTTTMAFKFRGSCAWGGSSHRRNLQHLVSKTKSDARNKVLGLRPGTDFPPPVVSICFHPLCLLLAHCSHHSPSRVLLKGPKPYFHKK